jgi:NAD(P)-dependent dehydrogenase (short-subunit alcohol dehydrogenase family)
MTNEIFSVQDKIIIITGGLGLLGSEFARHLSEQGAKIAVFDDNTAAPEIMISKNYLVLEVDVTDKESIKEGLSRVMAKWGTPHGLVNCAAIDFPPNRDQGDFENYSETSWKMVMDVNVKGVFLCCQVIGTEMAMLSRGSIINIGSTYGMVSPDQRIYGGKFVKPISYAVSKSALLNMSRYLATYWGRKYVRVNTLTLGGVYNNQDPEFVRNYTERVPQCRMARKNEYNGAVQFLLSDASSYMTGANLVIDGGWTAW